MVFQKQKEQPNTFIQPQLEIGKEDDEHEKEANHVAVKVMRMTDPTEGKLQKMHSGEEDEKKKMSTGNQGKLQMMLDRSPLIQKMAEGSGGGMTASKNVEQGINSSKGSGQSLAPDVQNEMGSKIGADFSGVKIHTNEKAVQMNQEVGAKAFTHGSDIYFNNNQYNPSSNQGKHLLAHELTHTVQQGKGIRRNVVQRATAATNFGQFETTRFAGIDPGDRTAGVSIVLKFHPDERKVDARKIALSQSVKTTDSTGKPIAIDPNSSKRMVGANKAGAGYRIDQLSRINNPIYSQGANLGPNQKLKDTPQSSAVNPEVGINTNYELGYCYQENLVELHKKKHDAAMSDRPSTAKVKGRSMTFETAAFAIEGTDKNTYYGSVKWGFKIEGTTAAPVLTVSNILPASSGTPTENFMQAAVLWNAAKTGGSLVVVADPASVHESDGRTPGILAKGKKVRQISTATIGEAPAIRALVLNDNGTSSARIIFIKNADLVDMGDGRSTKNLPMKYTTGPVKLNSLYLNVTIPAGTSVQMVNPEPPFFRKNEIKVLSGLYAGVKGEISNADMAKISDEGD